MATEYKLSYTGQEIDEKLREISKLTEPTGVEAGTYGSFGGPFGTYNIPSIEVDELGRITAASNKVLSQASTTESGYLSFRDYKKIASIPATVGSYKYTILAGSTESSMWMCNATVDGDAQEPDIAPFFYITGTYIDVDGYKWIIPINWRAYRTRNYDSMYDRTSFTYRIVAAISEPVEYDIIATIYSNYQFGGAM